MWIRDARTEANEQTKKKKTTNQQQMNIIIKMLSEQSKTIM